MSDNEPKATGGVWRNYIAIERGVAGIKTQKALAELAGIEPSWFVRIENGRALASPEELDAIANALGGIPLTRLYDAPYLQAIGAARAAQLEVEGRKRPGKRTARK